MMNSSTAVAANAVSAYSNHSYYRGDHSLSSAAAAAVTGHSVPATWPSIGANGLPAAVFDYYGASAGHDYYGYPDPIHYSSAANNSTGTPSPHSLDNGSTWTHHHPDMFYSQLNGSNIYTPYAQANKKRGVANSKKERRRTISINGAFSNLRDCIPNVPKDTKLSKIKTLRLACSYIQHLMDALNSDATQPLKEFKADLTRKTPCRAEKRKCIEAEIAAAAERKARGRSGWPQTIWAQDLKNDTLHKYTTTNSEQTLINSIRSNSIISSNELSSGNSHDDNDGGPGIAPSYTSSDIEDEESCDGIEAS